MISFCPDTNINFDEFMFTTDLFAIQEDNEDYIFERIQWPKEKHSIIFTILKDGNYQLIFGEKLLNIAKLLTH